MNAPFQKGNKASTKGNKVTGVEREKRIARGVELLTQGYSLCKTEQIICQEAGISYDYDRRWARQAVKRLAETRVAKEEEYKELLLNRLDDLYYQSYQKGNYPTALKALQQLADITGSNAPTKQEINLNTTAEFDFS